MLVCQDIVLLPSGILSMLIGCLSGQEIDPWKNVHKPLHRSSENPNFVNLYDLRNALRVDFCLSNGPEFEGSDCIGPAAMGCIKQLGCGIGREKSLQGPNLFIA